MSAIASFHLVAATDVDELIDAAIPKRTEVKKKFLIFTRREVVEEYRLPAFLEEKATEGEAFDYSGYAFTDLETFLADQDGPSILGSFRQNDCEKIAREAEATIGLYDNAEARRLVEELDKFQLVDSDLEAFLKSEYEIAEPEGIEAIKEARDQLKRWLAQVGEGTVGMLQIG